MDIINTTQSDILNLLARFKFLVISQMQPILGKSISYMRQQLASLTNRGYIKSFQLDRPGKAENMYYLTESGKEVILQHSKAFDGDIRLPIGTPLLVKDYGHRKSMISLGIYLHYHLLHTDVSIKEFIYYFDKLGNNRKSANLEAQTKIPLGENGFFIPDGIMLTESKDEQTIYLLEMYCDSSSTRVLDQLQKHILAIAQGSPGTKFGIHANPFVLSAFEHSSIKEKVVEKLRHNEKFSAFQHLFFFSSLEEVKNDCGIAWHTITGEILVFS